jgi:hypothetical protein
VHEIHSRHIYPPHGETVSARLFIIALVASLAFNPIASPADTRKGHDTVRIRGTMIFTGTCTVQLFVDGAKGPCDSKVIFANLTNGRSWFTFSRKFDNGKYFAYTVSGGHDRQPQIENYYLSIDTLRIQLGKEAPAVDTHMEGECHTTFDKMETRDIECVVYDRSNGLSVTLHLGNITDTKH